MGRQLQFVQRLSLLVAVLALTSTNVRAQGFNEYQVKAAFLYNFAKFVEWPSQSFKGPKDSLNICVLGEDPFGQLLTDTVNGKTLEGRPFVVHSIPDVQSRLAPAIFSLSALRSKNISDPSLRESSGQGY